MSDPVFRLMVPSNLQPGDSLVLASASGGDVIGAVRDDGSIELAPDFAGSVSDGWILFETMPPIGMRDA